MGEITEQLFLFSFFWVSSKTNVCFLRETSKDALHILITNGKTYKPTHSSKKGKYGLSFTFTIFGSAGKKVLHHWHFCPKAIIAFLTNLYCI